MVYLPTFAMKIMYGIFTYIYHENQPNVGKYTVHGWYGIDNGIPFRIYIKKRTRHYKIAVVELQRRPNRSSSWHAWPIQPQGACRFAIRTKLSGGFNPFEKYL